MIARQEFLDEYLEAKFRLEIVIVQLGHWDVELSNLKFTLLALFWWHVDHLEENFLSSKVPFKGEFLVVEVLVEQLLLELFHCVVLQFIHMISDVGINY